MVVEEKKEEKVIVEVIAPPPPPILQAPVVADGCNVWEAEGDHACVYAGIADWCCSVESPTVWRQGRKKKGPVCKTHLRDTPDCFLRRTRKI